jgi:D-beta-D-heptose 7-phosphate kinase/D-beta-D-heptose 1-phosphate adenosyltransferase
MDLKVVDRFRDCTLAVVGDVMLDRFIYGRTERVSPEAPALVLQIESERWVLGGAANVAANIAALGGQAILVGRIGADEGALTIDRLAAEHGGRIIVACAADPDWPTTVKTRYLAGDRHLLRADQERIGLSQACEARIIEDIRSAVARADAVVVSDYAKGVLTDRVLATIFAAARERNIPVLVDPKRRNLAAYRGATVLTPNRRELALATGIDGAHDEEIDEAAAMVMADTAAAILVTRSEHGVSLYRPGEPAWRHPATAARVRDVSGAGDTVAAALALALAAGAEMVAAAQLANCAAGVAVGKPGTSLVSPAELLAAGSFLRNAPATFDGDGGPTKLRALNAAVAMRERWREEGLRVGFTNGCFDLIHPGHVQILRRSADRCDKLIVALNSDASVRRLKGPSRPVQNEAARAAVMEALEAVDLVMIFDEDTPLTAIQMIEPDILFKGADYREDEVVGGDIVKSWGGKVVLVELAQGHSTTNLIARSKSPSDAA